MTDSEFKAEVIAYLRIEDDDVDIDSIIDAAIQRLEIETGKMFDTSLPLARQAVKMLVLDWYDHRGSITTENIHELPFPVGLQMTLNQIALSSEFTRKPMPDEVVAEEEETNESQSTD